MPGPSPELYYKLIEGSLAVCLYCRESSYFHTTMLCVLLGGCIRLHFNCDSEVPAVGTGSTSIIILLFVVLPTRHIYVRHISGDLNDLVTKIWDFFPKTAKFRTPN